MDGNLSKEGMTKDLESLKKAGIGNVVFLEVNVGVPRGTMDFLSDEWLKYYSGIAVYRKSFDLPSNAARGSQKLYLDLGQVKNISRIRLNGEELGVVWTAPWKVDITSTVKQKGNYLEIEVANLWPTSLSAMSNCLTTV